MSIVSFGWVEGWMEGWKDARVEGWKGGRMDGWKDGKGGRVEGWLPSRILLNHSERFGVLYITLLTHDYIRRKI